MSRILTPELERLKNLFIVDQTTYTARDVWAVLEAAAEIADNFRNELAIGPEEIGYEATYHPIGPVIAKRIRELKSSFHLIPNHTALSEKETQVTSGK